MKDKSILSTLKQVIFLLEKEKCTFAIAGGFLASLYRKDLRYTEDLDFLLFSESYLESVKIIHRQLKLETSLVKLHQLKRLPMMNKKSQPALIAVGRSKSNSIGVDFILPEMPWFSLALERAQSNLIDFGAGSIPALTIEDLIIAKVFAGRHKDIDDLISIFEAEHTLNQTYLYDNLKKLNLNLPKDVLKILPKKMARVFKK